MGLEKLSENQLKVIKDKYLRGDTLEKWLRGVTHNIALAELLYSDEIDKKKIFENVSYKTKDNNLSAHFEHTIAITKKGAKVLTKT